jgi:hypothetical protein
VRLHPGVVGLLAAGRDVRLTQFRYPRGECGVSHRQNALDGECSQVLLGWWLALPLADIVGPVGECRRAVLEADDKFLALLAVFLGDEALP